MKTLFEHHMNNVVYYERSDMFDPDVREHFLFFAPCDGGYVRYNVGGSNRQICKGLSQTGSCLYWDGHNPLIDLIREHHKLWKRDQHRMLSNI